MLKTTTKITVTAIITLVVLLAIFIFTLPYSLPTIIKHQLSKSGFTQPRLSIASMGFRQTVVNHIKLRKTLDNGTSFAIDIPSLILTYSPGGLIQKRLNQLTVKKPIFYLQLSFKKTKASKSSKPFTLKSIPMQHMNIKDATLSFAGPNKKSPLILKGSITANNSEKQSTLLFNLIPLDFSTSPFKLKRLFPSLKVPLVFSDGQLTLNGKLIWNNKNILQPNLNIIAKNISGAYDKIQFSNLNGKVTLTNFWPLQSAPNQQLTLNQLKNGAVISNIKATPQLTGTKTEPFGLSISDISASIVDGQLKARDIFIRGNHTEKPFILTVKNVDLATLLKPFKEKTFQMTGKLSGAVPISIGPQGITIKKGYLSAQSAGVIRYQSEATAATIQEHNASLSFTQRALSDFQYKKLSIFINNDAKKDETVIKIHASGKNPHFQQGHSIQLNLSISFPLKRVLKYYLLGNQIDDLIQDSFQ